MTSRSTIGTASSTRHAVLVVLLALLHGGLLFHVVAKGPMRAIDSLSYWEMEPIRTPLYPLLLQPFLRAGPLHESFALMGVQLALGGGAILVLCLYLRRRFELPAWFTGLLSLLLCAPYVTAELGNQVLSEGLAYPLFLLFVRWFLPALLDGAPVSFGVASLLTIPLVLTRGQFLFLYPLLALALAVLLLERPARRSALARAGVVLGIAVVAAGLLERSYHRVVHERFAPTPYTGIHLLALPLYVATAEDAERFDGDEHAFFEECFTRLTRKNLTADSFVDGLVSPHENVSSIGKRTRTARNLVARGRNQDQKDAVVGRPRQPPAVKRRGDPQQVHSFRGFRMTFQNFTRNFETIVHETIKPQALGRGAEGPEIDRWIDADRLTTSVALELMRANPLLYAKYYGMNVLEGLGRRQHAPLFLALLALAVLARGRNAPAMRFLLVAGLVALANVLLVALVQPTHVLRYTLYGDVLTSVAVAVAVFVAARGASAVGEPDSPDPQSSPT